MERPLTILCKKCEALHGFQAQSEFPCLTWFRVISLPWAPHRPLCVPTLHGRLHHPEVCPLPPHPAFLLELFSCFVVWLLHHQLRRDISELPPVKCPHECLHGCLPLLL